MKLSLINESNSKHSFANVYDPHDWDYCRALVSAIHEAYPYLTIPELEIQEITSVLDALMNQNEMTAAKILHNSGANPKASDKNQTINHYAQQWSNYWAPKDDTDAIRNQNSNRPTLKNIERKRELPPAKFDSYLLNKLYKYGLRNKT